MAGELLYDRERLRSLHVSTTRAASFFQGIRTDEPAAHDAVETVRSVSFRLGSEWIPWFGRVLGDTSMVAWDASAPGNLSVTHGQGFGGGRPTGAEEELDAAVDEMTALSHSVMGGNTDALLQLAALVTENGSDPAVMSAYRAALGPDGVRDLAQCLEDAHLPMVLAPERLEALEQARSAVASALAPDNPFAFPAPSGNFSLADSLTTAGGSWMNSWNPGCVSPSGGEYGGGGFVRGPDGRLYPIVVPSVTDENGRYTADWGMPPTSPSVANLDGTDAEWRIVAYEYGVERFVERPDLAVHALPFILQGVVELPVRPPNSALASIAMSPFAPPSFAGNVTGRSAALPEGDVDVADPADSSAGNVVGSGVEVLANGTQAALVSLNIDNQNERAYQVIFEENAAGDIRARIQTYTLAFEDDELVIVPEHVWLDQLTGELYSQAISYRHPGWDSSGIYPSGADLAAFATSGAVAFTYALPNAALPRE